MSRGPAASGEQETQSAPWGGFSTAVLAAAAAVALGLITSGVLVWESTTSFSATTSNGPNSWSLGAVTLTDDDDGTALFSATGLTPGSTGSNCLSVSYTATAPVSVKLYAGASHDPSGVGRYLNLAIERGTGGGFGSCAGFVASSTIYSGTLGDFTASRTDFASGVGDWTPSGPATAIYKFSYTLDALTPGSKQSAVAGATFQWEAQY